MPTHLDWVLSLITLTVLEIVLGIDNIIFISILVGRVAKPLQKRVRLIGLGLAFFGRVSLLFSLGLLLKLQTPLLHVAEVPLSGKDITLLLGGLFLLYKATKEIHVETECASDPACNRLQSYTEHLGMIVLQIVLIDIVFSLDSVITAVGLAQQLWVMVTAVLISIVVMMVALEHISTLIDRHPSIKILALSFLMLIGAMLVADAFHVHVPRPYIYFALAFSTGVEWLNIKTQKRPPGHTTTGADT